MRRSGARTHGSTGEGDKEIHPGSPRSNGAGNKNFRGPRSPAGQPKREGQTVAGQSLAARYASFVKLPHTLFALPFAGVGAVLASYPYPQRVTIANLLWIVLAFTAARFAAMGFNRIIDRRYDALNPRTSQRELPTGRLTLVQAIGAVVVASVVFIFAAFRLNALCGYLAPVALLWTFFYSYTKRFTSIAHWVLGLSLGIAPVGAYLAIAGHWSDPAWALPLLAAAVMLWVAGFDIVYSLQDIEFDREHKLHSVPARFGAPKSLLIARAAHALSVVCFLALLLSGAFPVGWLFAVAVGLMAGLLYYEHLVVRERKDRPLDLKTVDRAFFRINIVVSSTFFVLTLLDRLLLS
jgi:4-hydroxybenzoate polyprenyltransferase